MLSYVNSLHSNRKFTYEMEIDGTISFLDLILVHEGSSINVSWYKKKTDTNVYLNFYSICPTQYKKSVVCGAVHRLFHITWSWKLFHQNIRDLQQLLEANQYPPSFYNPLVRKSLNKILDDKSYDKTEGVSSVKNTSLMLFIQHRG